MATESNPNRVAYEFDPLSLIDAKKIPADQRQEAREAVAEFIKEAVLNYVGEGKSPVKDGKWKKKITDAYKERKDDESSNLFSNLELSGELLDALNAYVSGDKVVIGVEGDQAPKADGNNRGTYGKPSSNPDNAREFIPKPGQRFKDEIISDVINILDSFMSDEDEE